jgi:hypothetical protein
MERNNLSGGAIAPGVDSETAAEIELLRAKKEEMERRLKNNLPPAERERLRTCLSKMEEAIHRVLGV